MFTEARIAKPAGHGEHAKEGEEAPSHRDSSDSVPGSLEAPCRAPVEDRTDLAVARTERRLPALVNAYGWAYLGIAVLSVALAVSHIRLVLLGLALVLAYVGLPNLFVTFALFAPRAILCGFGAAFLLVGVQLRQGSRIGIGVLFCLALLNFARVIIALGLDGVAAAAKPLSLLLIAYVPVLVSAFRNWDEFE